MKNLISLVALILSLIAITMCTICCLSKDKVIEKALNENPEMIINALQRYEQVAMEKQLQALEGLIKENADDIYNNPTSPYVGPETAKATLVLFYDYSCGYCHRLYPAVKSLSEKNADVKFVFKPLMFLGPISEYSAKAVMAANQQGKFMELNDALFNFEEQLTEEKIDELAEKAGVNMSEYKTAVASAEVEKYLVDSSNLASKIQIQGVPTMILGGKVLQTFDASEIQRAIDEAKK